MSAFSPDVLVIDLDTLVDDGAITASTPSTPEEKDAVAAALGTQRVAVTPAIAFVASAKAVAKRSQSVVVDRRRHRDVAARREVDPALDQLVEEQLLEDRIGGREVGR